jgi:lipopolysaccharide biosynthesis regulator YciM
VWLTRALAVNENEAEATLCLGDLYSRSGNLEEAKKCYDKICSAVRLAACYFYSSFSVVYAM